MNEIRNTSLDSPQVLLAADDLAYDKDFPEAARVVIVDAAVEPSLLVLQDINGKKAKFTFGDGCPSPYVIEGQWSRIVGNGSGSAGTGANVAGGSSTALEDITVLA